tara:strand:- start:20 stop:430 length:411 start_codon:yes stop_codon:yes gene_type:complete
VVIALVAVFGSCVHAHAAPCQEAAPVRVGDVVACAGLLVPIDQAARAIDCATVTLPELQARSSAELKSCVADYDASRRIAETERNRGARLAVALDKMSATVEPVPLWKHPATWASVGFILGATATIYLMTGFERAQ